MPLSKTQVDRLGDRLRREITEEDQRAYAAYRAEFIPALAEVVARVDARVRGMELTARRKTLDTVAAKLRRSSMRLSQMQDVAGCRVVVESLVDQDEAVDTLRTEFPGATVDDLRSQPHSGYRAVHLTVTSSDGKRVEIQVRTRLQNQWAQLSEKAADIVGHGIKYDGGPPFTRSMLENLSRAVADLDRSKQAATTARRGVHRVDQALEEIREAATRADDSSAYSEQEARLRSLVADLEALEERIVSGEADVHRLAQELLDIAKLEIGTRDDSVPD